MKAFLLTALLSSALVACEPGKDQNERLFSNVSPGVSGVDFENRLTSSDDFNIIEYLYFYNGGGVAVGDVNNDGLVDLYFTGNQVGNKLYLNKGDFKFEDISERAGVAGTGNWKTGATMADVDGDGWLDIYVCGVGRYKSFDGQNQLYINNHDSTFTERSKEYGLDFQGFSTQSVFFDYDNDGDLDMYLLNHSVHSVRSYGDVALRMERDSLAGDRLYRQDLGSDGKRVFTDVTRDAGIFSSSVGYGLAVGVSDLDHNGFADIYVSNDFHENDYLYLNKGDGTFAQVLEQSMAHTSRFSMGNDIADINEDGWNDIVTLDMMPSDEYVIKTTAGEDNYEIYQYKLQFGYHNQFSRNCMQISAGKVDHGRLRFYDVAPFAGVAATDWSWSALLADFDNDGGKDLFVANGIVGRPNDLDYISYISTDSAQKHLTDEQLYSKMPSGKAPNAIFKKGKGLRFEDKSSEWLDPIPTFSNGAAYADLDNDGDLDLVINNINEKASVLRNNAPKDSTSHFLRIKLNGLRLNPFGVGAAVTVYAGGQAFHREQNPTRGWLSSVDQVLHVGLGPISTVDSVVVTWPGNKHQRVLEAKIDATLDIREIDQSDRWLTEKESLNWYSASSDAIPFKHQENDFNVLETQRLIPHMNSTRGPKLAVGDVNGDQLEDVYVGGGQGQSGQLFLQDRNGRFVWSRQPVFEVNKMNEETAALFFDADGDGDLDLMVGNGGDEFVDDHLKLRLYFNDKGEFKEASRELTRARVNASALVAGDVDHDGDLDVFVAGGTVTGRYGIDSDSFVLVNDGHGNFEEKASVFEGGRRPGGMLHAALWIELTGDDFPELVTAGEWAPVLVWKNNNGVLSRITQNGTDQAVGWWNALASGDFDGDGDTDLVAGNFGLNGRIQITNNETVEIIITDLDNNAALDQVLIYQNRGKRHTLASKDQLIRQVPALKKQYLRYSDYARATSEQVVGSVPQMKRMANTMASLYFENIGNGNFVARPLPDEAQYFPVMAICTADVNDDGYLDLVLGGNLLAVQPDLWPFDAGFGVILVGDGHSGFSAVPTMESGFFVKGETRDIKTVKKGNSIALVATQNNDSLLIFTKRKPK